MPSVMLGSAYPAPRYGYARFHRHPAFAATFWHALLSNIQLKESSRNCQQNQTTHSFA
ncbi:hypothetical protein PENSUB_1941 [Penicillium subrubescens]|uniref:Uncharacterized protein n=1 Tax=Penicillium subrubescens TaxID=1316194 RepID=A0A1Q5UI88_9EURO|nr:hypothetical protein PENSUB_1941 [Penicillium subrubescens]